MKPPRYHIRLESNMGGVRQTRHTFTKTNAELLCKELNAVMVGRIKYTLVRAAGESLSSDSPAPLSAQRLDLVSESDRLHP